MSGQRDEVADLRESLRGVGMTLTRIEKVMRDELQAMRQNAASAAAIATNTACLPQLAKDLSLLLDVLVEKRTNGHTALEQASMPDAEGTKAP